VTVQWSIVAETEVLAETPLANQMASTPTAQFSPLGRYSTSPPTPPEHAFQHTAIAHRINVAVHTLGVGVLESSPVSHQKLGSDSGEISVR